MILASRFDKLKNRPRKRPGGEVDGGDQERPREQSLRRRRRYIHLDLGRKDGRTDGQTVSQVRN